MKKSVAVLLLLFVGITFVGCGLVGSNNGGTQEFGDLVTDDEEDDSAQMAYTFEESDSATEAAQDTQFQQADADGQLFERITPKQIDAHLEEALGYLGSSKSEADCAEKRRYAVWAADEVVKAKNGAAILRTQDAANEGRYALTRIENALEAYADVVEKCQWESEPTQIDALLKEGTDSLKVARACLRGHDNNK